MRIGELAARSGVTVRTVRYYIEQGLLPMPNMRGKYGEFDESYVQRLQLIQNLKRERLPIPAIRQRLADMGLVPAPAFAPAAYGAPTPLSESAGGHRAERGEGLFRSRFAEEAGLTSEQVAQMERLGLLTSSEGLLPPAALPLARAVAKLLAWGARMEDVAEIAQQVQAEASLHRRLLDRQGSTETLRRALQWQEQVGAVDTIRQTLLQRWGYVPDQPAAPTSREEP